MQCFVGLKKTLQRSDHLDTPQCYWENDLWTDEAKAESFAALCKLAKSQQLCSGKEIIENKAKTRNTVELK